MHRICALKIEAPGLRNFVSGIPVTGKYGLHSCVLFNFRQAMRQRWPGIPKVLAGSGPSGYDRSEQIKGSWLGSREIRIWYETVSEYVPVGMQSAA